MTIFINFSVSIRSASYLNAPRDILVTLNRITPNNNQISINFTINFNFTTTSRTLKSLSVKDQNGKEIFYVILPPSSNEIVEVRNNSRYGNRVNIARKLVSDGYTLTIQNMTMADEGEIIGYVLYEQTDDIDSVEYFVERTFVYITVKGKYFLIMRSMQYVKDEA